MRYADDEARKRLIDGIPVADRVNSIENKNLLVFHHE